MINLIDILLENDDEHPYSKAYNNHIEYLKSFVKDVLHLDYDKTNINLGWSDLETEDEIIIHSKIYISDGDIIFSTYHDEGGNLINFEYEDYTPKDLTKNPLFQKLLKQWLEKRGLDDNGFSLNE